MTAVERALARVDRSTGCWLYTGGLNADGYATIRSDDGRTAYVHRLVYAALVGPIPAELTIDHLCRVRHCCNPEHLEPVTRGLNTLRGDTIPAGYRLRTHCSQGHPFDLLNTAYEKGTNKRYCKTCKAAKARRQYHRKRATLLVATA